MVSLRAAVSTTDQWVVTNIGPRGGLTAGDVVPGAGWAEVLTGVNVTPPAH